MSVILRVYGTQFYSIPIDISTAIFMKLVVKALKLTGIFISLRIVNDVYTFYIYNLLLPYKSIVNLKTDC